MPAPPDLVERIGGASFAAGAHRALVLDDPGRIYVVEQGHLDIFAAEFRGAEVVNRRPFATRVPAGSVALAAPRAVQDDRVFGLLGVPSRSAVLVEGTRSGLAEGPLDVGLVSWIDDWVGRLSELLSREAGPVPRGTRLLEADPDVPYPAGGTLSAHHRDVVWMSADRPVRLMGSPDLAVAAGDVVPISERTWVETGREEARVSAVHTPRALLSGSLWPALDRFATLVLLYSVTVRREESEAIRERHRGIREAHRSANRSVRHDLAAVLGTATEGGPADPGGRAPAEAVLRLVADSVGVATPLRRAAEKTADPLEAYLALARGSAARARRITLAPGWWRRDGPSFAGVTDGDERPIAVLSDGRGRYRAVDPAAERSFRVGRREAAGIAAEGVMLYPPFPARVRGVAAALGHAVGAVTADLRSVLFMSVLSSIVALATPVLTGHLLATAIPRSDTPMWIAGLAALFLCALGGAVFQVVQTFALLRTEGRLDERLQCALWSRVLSLPAGFFRQYAAGDLADRLGGCRPSARCCPGPPSGPSWAGCSRCRASGCWRTTACTSPSSPAGWCWRSSW
ncbi:MAG: ABC transporter transmembrane domain-containing protein [Acidobacteria bacterium]|nr:ABC transporter transmembrane domain-containing protein [Acidobacteriota bacterium]